MFLDHRCYDVAERQLYYPVVFLDGGRHASGECNISFTCVLTFFLSGDRVLVFGPEFVFVVLEYSPLLLLSFNDDVVVD